MLFLFMLPPWWVRGRLIRRDFQTGTDTRSPARRRRAGREVDNDQVRRWRGLVNEETEMPGAKIPGLCRTMGVAQAARKLAAADGFCIRILEVSRMFHPASVGVAGAMQTSTSLSKR
jgi:hypothetical protein